MACPSLVTQIDGALVLQAAGEPGVLEDDGLEIATDLPAIGVNFEAAGPPIGTEIGLEVVGGLLRHDGDRLVVTEATLTIEAPEFDSRFNANETEIPEYTVGPTTERLTGMTWSRYPGGSFWEADGYFTLDGDSPPAGLYGVPVRLIDRRDDGPLEPSEPFVLPWLYDPACGVPCISPDPPLAGLAAFESLTGGDATGDFDRSGVVDRGDYDLWSTQYGLEGVFAADGDGDGRVTAADYTMYRDALPAASVAVPEPHALLLTCLTACVAAAFFRETSECAS